MESITYLSNSSTIVPSESWFIPCDIFRIICNSLSIIFATIFLVIILVDKTCHTVPMMLVANSCLNGLLVGCCFLSYSIFTLNNDLKKIDYEDSLCVIRTYIKTSVYTIFNYSFMFQSFYRYLIVVYPTRLFFKTFKFQGLLIFITWIINIIFPFPFVLFKSIEYDVNNQICMVLFRLDFSLIYLTLCMYAIPVGLTQTFYFKLIRYVRGMNRRVIPANTISRAQRELKMVQRTVMLVAILMILGLIMIVFVFMSFFTAPPKYYFRIGFMFTDPSLTLVMIVLYMFNDPLKASIKKRINIRKSRVVTILHNEENPLKTDLILFCYLLKIKTKQNLTVIHVS